MNLTLMLSVSACPPKRPPKYPTLVSTRYQLLTTLSFASFIQDVILLRALLRRHPPTTYIQLNHTHRAWHDHAQLAQFLIHRVLPETTEAITRINKNATQTHVIIASVWEPGSPRSIGLEQFSSSKSVGLERFNWILKYNTAN